MRKLLNKNKKGSKWVFLENKGVRQDCSLSSILFLTYLEDIKCRFEKIQRDGVVVGSEERVVYGSYRWFSHLWKMIKVMWRYSRNKRDINKDR